MGIADYRIYHDQIAYATSATFYNISAGTNYVFPPLPNPIGGPLRGEITLPDDFWVDLYTGNVGVRIYLPDGVMTGRIQCVGTCTPPPSLVQLQCVSPAANVLEIYSDSKTYPIALNDYSSTGSGALYNYTTNPFCGNASIMLTIPPYGSFAIQLTNSTGLYILSSVYQYFEFFVRVISANETAKENWRIQFRQANTTFLPQITTIPSSWISNTLIGNEWTRIKVPLANASFSSNQSFRYFYFSSNVNFPVSLQLDELRFVGGTGSVDPSSVPITSGQYTYVEGSDTCQNLGLTPSPPPGSPNTGVGSGNISQSNRLVASLTLIITIVAFLWNFA